MHGYHIVFQEFQLTFDFAEFSLEHVIALARVPILPGLGQALGVVQALVVGTGVGLRLLILVQGTRSRT